MVENGRDSNFSNAEALFRFVFRLFLFFLQKLQFHATSKTLSNIHVIKKASHFGPFPKNEQITSEILVPPIAPSYLQYCKIIDLNYELIVSVHISSP